MKRTQEKPSVAGLLLIVTGMLLISVAALKLLDRGTPPPGTGKVLIELTCGGLLSCVAGAALSGRKRKTRKSLK